MQWRVWLRVRFQCRRSRDGVAVPSGAVAVRFQCRRVRAGRCCRGRCGGCVAVLMCHRARAGGRCRGCGGGLVRLRSSLSSARAVVRGRVLLRSRLQRRHERAGRVDAVVAVFSVVDAGFALALAFLNPATVAGDTAPPPHPRPPTAPATATRAGVHESRYPPRDRGARSAAAARGSLRSPLARSEALTAFAPRGRHALTSPHTLPGGRHEGDRGRPWCVGVEARLTRVEAPHPPNTRTTSPPSTVTSRPE